MACGSDFILTTNSAGNVYAKGANKFGQLGLGSQKPMPNFKCNEFFLDQKVEAIYAGSRSAFAFSDMTGNSMTEFISEFNDVNQGGFGVKRPKGLVEIALAEGGTILVSKVTWECYFPAELR